MEGHFTVQTSHPCFRVDRLPQDLLQTSTLPWLLSQVIQQTPYCILLWPSTQESTQIQLPPITCLHQCRPSWTCPHQSPRWFQRRMGSSCCTRPASSRQDARCQWTQVRRKACDHHLYATGRIWCRQGAAPQSWCQDPRWCRWEGYPTILQHKPSSGLRSFHLLRPWTSQHQHACTHHAFTIYQPLLHASSFWQSTQPYMGTLSWNYIQFRSTDPLGG